MENKCVVKSCEPLMVDLFISPQDPELLKKWQVAVNTSKTFFFVCDKHFVKKDIVIDKNLEERAIPLLHLSDEIIKLENDCCGICLDDLEENLEMSLEMKQLFLEITKYEPLTDLICQSCQFGLTKYKEFKNEIQLKHAEIRNAANAQMIMDDNNEINEDDEELLNRSSEYKAIDKDLLEHSEDKKKFDCNQCAFKCRTASTLDNHIKKSHSGESSTNKAIVCKYCNHQSANSKDLITHIEESHYFKCPKCKFYSVSSMFLQRHLRRNHGIPQDPESKTYSCNNCLCKFNSKVSFQCHKKFCTEDKTGVVCFFCTQRFSTDIMLKNHNCSEKLNARKKIQTKRTNSVIENRKVMPIKIISPKIFISKVVSQATPSQKLQQLLQRQPPSNLKRVKKKITPQRPRDDTLEELVFEEVTIEEEQFEESHEFEETKVFKLPKSNEKPDLIKLKCRDCKIDLKNIQELLLHRESFHPDKVQQNEAIKRQVKKTKCIYCEKDIFEYCMGLHIKIHHKVESKRRTPEFSCELCVQRFHTTELKNFHLHSFHQVDGLIFMCDFCGKEFASKQSIKCHMINVHLDLMKHHEEICSICQQKFSRKVFLERHMKNLHVNDFDCGSRVNSKSNVFKCGKCSAVHHSLRSFRQHDCKKYRQFRCDGCNMPCKTAESLKHHHTFCKKYQKCQ